MFANAQAEAARIGLLRNSIRGGAGNIVGCLGEQAFLFMFPGSVSSNTFHHDVVYKRMTIECKTKERTGVPVPSYEASVANYNATQQADVYAFLSVTKVNDRYTKAYFCGFIMQDEYQGRSTFMEKGTIDPSNGWEVQADCWNLPYSELER